GMSIMVRCASGPGWSPLPFHFGVAAVLLAAALTAPAQQDAKSNDTQVDDKTAALNAAELKKCLAKLPEGTRHEALMVPLRDGIKLATDVFLPPRGDGPWPVLLLRTPYSRFDPRPVGVMDDVPCVLVCQNQRGRYGSEGSPPPDSFRNEVDDSYDAI